MDGRAPSTVTDGRAPWPPWAEVEAAIEAKNGLEDYCFTIRNTLQEERLQEKLEGDDKDKIEKAVQFTLEWLAKNQLADKDQVGAQQKKLQEVVNPIMRGVARLLLLRVPA